MKTYCRTSGIWDCISEDGKYLGQIRKGAKGWMPTFGYFDGRFFNTLNEARDAAIYK